MITFKRHTQRHKGYKDFLSVFLGLVAKFFTKRRKTLETTSVKQEKENYVSF